MELVYVREWMLVYVREWIVKVYLMMTLKVAF